MNRKENIQSILALCPILDKPDAAVPPSLTIQVCLTQLPRGSESPFAKVPGTHMARLSVVDDVARVTPALNEHLKTAYLLFEANFDDDDQAYLRKMAQTIPEIIDSVWQNCVGFPGAADQAAFVTYMERCKIKSTFRFTGANTKTVTETLQALHTQSAVAEFVRKVQGKPAEEVRRQFVALSSSLRRSSVRVGESKRKEHHVA